MLHYSTVCISYETLNFYIYPDIHFYPETSSYLKKSIEIRYLPYCLTLSLAYYLGFIVNGKSLRGINLCNKFLERTTDSESKKINKNISDNNRLQMSNRFFFLCIIVICNVYSYVLLDIVSGITSFIPSSMLFFFLIAYLAESLGMFFLGYVRGKG
jgi:hypothetical protein